MEKRILVLTTLLVLMVACKDNQGKTAGVNGDITRLDISSVAITASEFLGQAPNLDTIVNNGRYAGVLSLRMKFNYDGSFAYRVRTATSIDSGFGQVYASPDYRTGLQLRAYNLVLGQIFPYRNAQGAACANILLSPNQFRGAISVSACESMGYQQGQNDQYGSQNGDWRNRRDHRYF